MYKELVSIITPAYNCSKYIAETIESVLSQSYYNWEMLIVDDCSTDQTADIINEYSKNDSRIKYYRLEQNSGPALARNKAVEAASGSYIAFLDSDDVWHADKLEKQIHYMKKQNITFCSTSYDKIDEQSNNLGRIIRGADHSEYKDLLKYCPGNSTVIYDATRLGKFTIRDIKKRNDYVMWLNVIRKAGTLKNLDEVLSSHRIREGAISSNKLSLLKYHYFIYHHLEKLSIIYSVYLVMYWCAVSAFKLR